MDSIFGASLAALPQSLGEEVQSELHASWKTTHMGQRTILGSQLGVVVARVLARNGFSKKLTEYGGLRAIASQRLEGVVAWLHKQSETGGDDVYQLLLEPHAPATPEPVWYAADGTSHFLWNAFSNPKSRATIALDSQHALRISEAARTLPEGWLAISKPTAEHYYKLAREFAHNLGGCFLGQQAKQTLSEHDSNSFIKPWIELLRRSGSNHLRQWEVMRLDSAAQLLQSQLHENGLDESKATEYYNALRASQTAARKARSTNQDSPSPVRQSVSAINPESVSTSRALLPLVLATVSRMSEEELSMLWLPVGRVIRSLTEIQRSTSKM